MEPARILSRDRGGGYLEKNSMLTYKTREAAE